MDQASGAGTNGKRSYAWHAEVFRRCARRLSLNRYLSEQLSAPDIGLGYLKTD